ncbi:TOBE domain-containing protein [Bradyrhizobium sp. BR 1433]|uniref:TOBE domain-containing protein n=1 Tax=Bradyrhizobium sp. BR 1433 TaxID=3447967 RepID=UPI003EE4373F
MICCTLQSNLGSGNQIKVMIRPECVRLSRFDQPGEFGMRGVIQDRAFVGHAVRYTLSAGDQRLTGLQHSGSGTPILEPYDQVWVDWSPSDAISLAS